MDKYPKLNKAPILEALADIQVILPPDTDAAAFDQVYDQLKDRFPNREQTNIIEFGVTTSQGIPQTFNTRSGFAGLRLSSTDKKQFLQIGGHSFTYSHLAPYSDGDRFLDEASHLWDVFASITKPDSVTRLAVRCLNRIEIAFPMRDFDEYFRTFIKIAPELPQGMAGFSLRFVLPNSDNLAMVASITLQMDPPQAEIFQSDAPNFGVLFDIDVFQALTMEPDKKRLWQILENLRQYRNRVFFESLTEATLRMYR